MEELNFTENRSWQWNRKQETEEGLETFPPQSLSVLGPSWSVVRSSSSGENGDESQIPLPAAPVNNGTQWKGKALGFTRLTLSLSKKGHKSHEIAFATTAWFAWFPLSFILDAIAPPIAPIATTPLLSLGWFVAYNFRFSQNFQASKFFGRGEKNPQNSPVDRINLTIKRRGLFFTVLHHSSFASTHPPTQLHLLLILWRPANHVLFMRCLHLQCHYICCHFHHRHHRLCHFYELGNNINNNEK